MEAAFRTAAGLRRHGRLLAVLGPMLELGPGGTEEHRRLGARARSEYGFDAVVTVGAPQYGGEEVGTVESAVAALGPLSNGDVVLIKASRAAGLERVAAALAGPAGEDNGGPNEEGTSWSPS